MLWVQGCAVTVYNWQDIPEYHLIQRSSENEKKAFYKKFSIDKISLPPIGGGKVGFLTPENPTKVYDLYSLSPFVHQVAPETDAHFETVRQWDSIVTLEPYITLGVFMSEIIYGGALFIEGTNEVVTDARKGIFELPQQFQDQFAQQIITYGIIYLSLAVVYCAGLLYVHSQREAEYELIKDTYNKAFNKALRKQLQLSDDLSWLTVLPDSRFKIIDK